MVLRTPQGQLTGMNPENYMDHMNQMNHMNRGVGGGGGRVITHSPLYTYTMCLMLFMLFTCS